MSLLRKHFVDLAAMDGAGTAICNISTDTTHKGAGYLVSSITMRVSLLVPYTFQGAEECVATDVTAVDEEPQFVDTLDDLESRLNMLRLRAMKKAACAAYEELQTEIRVARPTISKRRLDRLTKNIMKSFKADRYIKTGE